MFYSWWKMKYAVFIGWLVGGRTEGHEFTREDPVQVTIVYFLVVLVLGEVEGFIVEPSELYSVLNTLKTVKELYFNRVTVHL